MIEKTYHFWYYNINNYHIKIKYSKNSYYCLIPIESGQGLWTQTASSPPTEENTFSIVLYLTLEGRTQCCIFFWNKNNLIRFQISIQWNETEKLKYIFSFFLLLIIIRDTNTSLKHYIAFLVRARRLYSFIICSTGSVHWLVTMRWRILLQKINEWVTQV